MVLLAGTRVVLSPFSIFFVVIDCIEFVQQPYPLRNGVTCLTGAEAGFHVRLSQCT
jgi:hypothetical protein